MRRVVTNSLRLAAAPVGAGVGLWMALLTYLPSCPVRGLAALSLCAPRHIFEPRSCVLFGTAAAATVLLASIAVRRRTSKVEIVDLGAAVVGIVLGLWASMMLYTYPPCGPHQLCVIVLAQHFATWQSALIGGAATAVILVAGSAVDQDIRRANLRAVRTVRQWLFSDLSGATAVGGAGSHSG